MNLTDIFKSQNNHIQILLILSITIGLIYCLFFPSGKIDGDEFEYNIIAKNLAEHNAFSMAEYPPFDPTNKREPLYPFFLSLIYRVFRGSFFAVMIAQAFIFSLTVIFIYSFISKIADNKSAFYSSIFVTVCPPLANYTSYILSEALFIFLLVVFVYISTMMRAHQTNKLFVASGVMLGLLTLCKAHMLYFFPFLILCIIISKWGKNIILPILLVTVAFLITLAPWLGRNYYLFNTWKITSQRAGMTLNVRAMKASYNGNDYKNAAIYYFSEELGKIIYPDAIIKSEAFMSQFNVVVEGREDEKYWRDYIKEKNFTLREGAIIDLKTQKFTRDGLSEVEIDKILTTEALQKIKAHPFKYLLQTPFELIKMTTFTYLPLLNEEYVSSRINAANKSLVFLIRSIIRLIAYPILALAIYGIYRYRDRWREFLPILFIIIFFNLFYGLTFGYAPYALPLMPFYIMFATMGWFKLRERKNIISVQQNL
ncbi:MAG: glycosyltransferase family 39 protein [Candidatus Omnitrophota bacterium]